MHDIISRKDARERGLKRYFTGRPCTQGHIGEGYTSSGRCVTCTCADAVHWQKNNREESNQRIYLSISRNYPKYAALWAIHNRRRKGVARQATPDWLDRSLLAPIYQNAPKGYDVDHGVPLKGKDVCGLNVPWNLEAVPASANRAKNNYFSSDEWSYHPDLKFVRTPLPTAPDFRFHAPSH